MRKDIPYRRLTCFNTPSVEVLREMYPVKLAIMSLRGLTIEGQTPPVAKRMLVGTSMETVVVLVKVVCLLVLRNQLRYI